MALLDIVQNALYEVGSLNVPASVIGSTDQTALQALALSNKVGKFLARTYSWEALKTDYTFSTVIGTFAYSLPADLKRFSNITFWDRTNRWPLIGPATDVEWQTLLGRLNPGGSRYWYRLVGNQFELFPTPTAVTLLAYTYVSNAWCQSSGGTNQSRWAADTDVGRLDEDLLTRGLVYELLAAKGLPSQAAYDTYNDAVDDLKSDDVPRGPINFANPDGPHLNWPLLPDGNFGS